MSRTKSAPGEWLTIAELAAVLGVSIRTAWRRKAAGLPSIRILGRTLFARSDVLAWIKTRESASPPRCGSRARAHRAGPRVPSPCRPAHFALSEGRRACPRALDPRGVPLLSAGE
ncbi:MAG: helix-turn-helix domain-containing protein, partial [Planctomycetes bacterium]|nr:helix-turn-helix domain-containing protein [Planctomycetota bacterium]